MKPAGRILGAALGLCLAAASALVATPAVAATALPAPVTSCSGVWVVVDRGNGETTVRCATSYATGTKALASAGLKTEATSGFICRIAAFPATCDSTGATGYWSYWHATAAADGTWTAWRYSSQGASSHHPKKGQAEGWRFQPLTEGVAPTLAPPAGYTAAPSPRITGKARVGRTLTVITGTWVPSPTLTLQWYRSGKAVKGATGPTYKLTRKDKGKRVSVKVTAAGAGLQTVSRSARTTKVKK
jgi:hypothetical protein